mmetsp:Transcript_35125/g.49894  ORF Transcript_35125/g.49894 Transcript_35125/m.49894 type:complete len:170 (+) Transcript_35125:364-873(+)
MASIRFPSTLLIICLLAMTADAFTPDSHSHSGNRAFSSRNKDTARRLMNMYVPPQTPTSITPPMSAQKILSTTRPMHLDQPIMQHSLALSHSSALSASETLPTFATSNGLLSPETVTKLDQMTAAGERNEAISLFLDTYRQKGPMSCLHLLSDPDVLPHLTEAMRDLTV